MCRRKRCGLEHYVAFTQDTARLPGFPPCLRRRESSTHFASPTPESDPVNTPTLPRLLVLATLLPLTGCAQSGGSKPTAATAPAPAQRGAPLPPAAGAAATLSEADTGRTVRLGLGETLAIRLAVNESTGNRWFMSIPLRGGVLAKKGNTTYVQTPDGTIATVLYQGLHVGTQELHFTYSPPEARQNISRTADFRVIVN